MSFAFETEDEVLAAADAIRKRRVGESADRAREIETRVIELLDGRGEPFTDDDLVYAAVARCPCGAGMAYPTDCGPRHQWSCSDILTGRAALDGSVQHERGLPFAFWSVKSERQPSANGATTRPSEGP